MRELPTGIGNYIQRGFDVNCQMKLGMRGDTIVFQPYTDSLRFKSRKLVDILVNRQEVLNDVRHNRAPDLAITSPLVEQSHDHLLHILKSLSKP